MLTKAEKLQKAIQLYNKKYGEKTRKGYTEVGIKFGNEEEKKKEEKKEQEAMKKKEKDIKSKLDGSV